MINDIVVNDPFYRSGTRFTELGRDRIDEALRLLREHQPRTILDVGFFPGIIGQALREHGFTGRLDGIGLLNGQKVEDFQPTYNQLFDHELDPFHGPVGAVGAIDLGQTYDLILGLEIVEHLLDPFPFFRLLATHLSERGVAFISTPNVSSFGAVCRLLRGRSNYESIERWLEFGKSEWRPHVRLYDRRELIDLGQRHGLKTIAHRYIITKALSYERQRGPAWFARRLASALVPWFREDQFICYRRQSVP